MAGSQISTSVTIIDSLLGFQAVSLTEFDTSAATAIAAGSKVEIAGGFFTFASDETPTDWSVISTGYTAYIALTPSGTAGSQVVDASYVSTAAVWSDSKQGYYVSAGSNVRIVAAVVKLGATSYGAKTVLRRLYSEEDLYTRWYDIGGWDMLNVANVAINTDLDAEKVRTAQAWIRSDTTFAGARVFGEEADFSSIERAGYIRLSHSAGPVLQVTLGIDVGGFFNATAYSATGGTIANRGFVKATYIA